MKNTVMHPVYGTITYDENIWTGKKTLSINGVVLPQEKKNIYHITNGAVVLPVVVKGNALTGASVHINGEEIVFFPKPSALDWILSVLPFVLILVWGNSKPLCNIVPVVGGGIGGAIGGLAMVLGMLQLRGKTVGGKLLVGLLALVAAFAVAAAVGCLILFVL